MIRQLFLALLLAVGAVGHAAAADAASSGTRNVLEKMTVASTGGQVTVRMSFRDPLPGDPPGFTTANPARLALDLANVDSALDRNTQAINQAFLRTVNLAQAGERLRVVMNLDRPATYELKRDGRDLYINLSSVTTADKGRDPTAVHFAPSPALAETNAAIRDISFRRGKDGEARVLVDVDSAGVGIDVQKQAGKLVVEFTGAALPDSLARKLDVNDFSTPVTSISTVRVGDRVRMTVAPRGNWEHLAYQADNHFVLEVRPIIEDPSKAGDGIGRFKGERIDLSLSEAKLKEVLLFFSEFQNFNVLVSENVTGNISIKLKDVPWDQALDIILRQKNLEQATVGNVKMIAPRAEILERLKQAAEAAPYEANVDQIFQVNYITATAARTRVTEYLNLDPTKPAGVKIMAEPTSNKLFIKAPESSMEEIRKLLREIDLPPKQVMIEARFVEAADSFNKQLGVRLSLVNSRDNKLLGGDNTTTRFGLTNFSTPAVSGFGTASFLLANAAQTIILNAELAAQEVDNKSKSIASPRVLAQNGQTATFDNGETRQVPVSAANGGTTSQTLSAILSLQVTPTITADGKVGMEISMTNNSFKNPSGFDTTNTAVKTKVVVENGGTVIIGGIYKETGTSAERRLPFFGDLPYVGFLFKQTQKDTARTEILVFITPRIVNEQLTLQ